MKNFEPLSKDEAGKLQGGFSLQSVASPLQIGEYNKNANCTNSGFGDTNINCGCLGCSSTGGDGPQPVNPPPLKPIKP